MRNRFFLIPCILFFFSSEAISLETFYGTFGIAEPILTELLETAAVQRLKQVQQYGVTQYVRPTLYPYSRYEHSIGVMVLLRRFGASLDEQVAGLLHDVSHTVFSHVGDHVAALQRAKRVNQNDDSYQDTMYTWYLEQTDVKAVLERYGRTVEDINPKNGRYAMLEQELPDLCADRLEYNLYGGYIEGLITQDEVRTILDALQYEDGCWFFDDLYQAKKFSSISQWLTEHSFAAVWNFVTYEFAAKALGRAMELGLLTIHDIHFSVDDVVWDCLHASSDAQIQRHLHNLKRYQTVCEEVEEGAHDATFVCKLRIINPWVRLNGALQRLFDIDHEIRTNYERLKASYTKPRYIRYIDVEC